MVSLREKAIKLAKEYEERKEKNEREAAKKFATKAKKKFEEIFGEVPYNVGPISEKRAKVIVGDLSFVAIRERTGHAEYINFYPQVECSHCGKLFTYQYPCNNLVDVGAALMKEVVCDACLYENVDTPKVTKSPAERVLELLSEILEIIEEERGE